jgi:hypothetical protein
MSAEQLWQGITTETIPFMPSFMSKWIAAPRRAAQPDANGRGVAGYGSSGKCFRCGTRFEDRLAVGRRRASDCHYCPGWVTGLWLAAGIVALLYSAGCREGVPVVDLGPKPPAARGTITGIVRGPEGTAPLSGRTVEIVDVTTGEAHTATTTTNGGFTIELPKGKYRLDLQLREGETVVKRPDVVDLDRGDIDSHIEFVVSPARNAKRPAYRLDNGLGSPIA